MGEKSTYRRINEEVMEIYDDWGIIGVVSAQRLRWLGHLMRMGEERTVKKVFKSDVSASKKEGASKRKMVGRGEKGL